MQRDDIEERLREVGAELQARGVSGEIVIVGGASMTLVLRSREATKDVVAYFDPSSAAAIREAVALVAARHDLPDDWLDDAVKGFFASVPETNLWAEFPGLKVDAVTPAYMFAMKAAAARLGDIEDIRSLATHLGITSSEAGLAVVSAHVPERLLTARTRLLLEELFEAGA